MREILVDGYNLIRQSDRLSVVERRRGLEAGRLELIRELAAYRKLTGDRIAVVFDGDDGLEHAPATGRRQGVSVTFSRPPRSADDLIVARVARAHGKKAMLVVSSDREIRSAARRHKVSVVDSARFAAKVSRTLREGPARASGPEPEGLTDDVGYWQQVFETERGMFEAEEDEADDASQGD